MHVMMIVTETNSKMNEKIMFKFGNCDNGEKVCTNSDIYDDNDRNKFCNDKIDVQIRIFDQKF